MDYDKNFPEFMYANRAKDNGDAILPVRVPMNPQQQPLSEVPKTLQLGIPVNTQKLPNFPRQLPHEPTDTTATTFALSYGGVPVPPLNGQIL